MDETKFENLMSQVSKRCNVTSQDTLIKDRLERIVRNACISVKLLLGITDDNFDFSQESKENEILLEYCFYRWYNKSQVEFDTNYRGDIIATRAKHEVAYAKTLEEVGAENE